jgi:hypothetical protein
VRGRGANGADHFFFARHAHAFEALAGRAALWSADVAWIG